jgi:DNA-binding CsgD family transcriptional regulator
MYSLDYNDYDDVLQLINRCVLCLKNGGKTEDILSAMLKSFGADQAVFLSADNKGVDLSNSYALCPDRTYLSQYANYFWRYDPLYDKQFCHEPDNLVFKTDDVIPYSQMVKLEYYNSFLRPQNLLGELIIRLYSNNTILGAISLQRFKDHPGFEYKDTQKASLLVPYLINIFETARKLKKINEELMLLEKWMESHPEGIILLDSQLKPLYLNSKAKFFYLRMNSMKERKFIEVHNADISLPGEILQDCLNMIEAQDYGSSMISHTNKIINTENQSRYFVQYFPVTLPSSEFRVPRFIIFLNELTKYGDIPEEYFIKQNKLSKREECISQYAAMGLTNKQIAEKLNISPFTVQNHLKNIFEKTGLDSRTKLASLIRFSSNPLF